MDAFDEIRPYHDGEVNEVLKRLLHNGDFIRALTSFNFPKLSRIAGPLLTFAVRHRLSEKLKHVQSVWGFQRLIEPYMIKMIQRTTQDINWSGLESLSKDRAYLFLSNHRDIVLDPALVNYGLHQDGRDTVRVAIGDNLLGKPYISDLMRLNKSFIVNRSAKARKEKIDALKTLSAYITHSVETGHSVWLAHREGRAKDGNDHTDSAIIKMLYFSHKNSSFAQMLEVLNIVPVSISYELNPCDFMIAKELYLRETTGEYVKAEEEDLHSMVSGIQGQKGRVHVTFGNRLSADTLDAMSCAEIIDRQIHHNYQLYPINYAAYSRLGEEGDEEYSTALLSEDIAPDSAAIQKGQSLLNERLALCDEKAQPWLLKLYANPVKNRLAADLPT